MAIQDYNKNVSIKNMTTGEITRTLDYKEIYPDYPDDDIFANVSIGEIQLLREIRECMKEGHGCLLSIGYKSK